MEVFVLFVFASIVLIPIETRTVTCNKNMLSLRSISSTLATYLAVFTPDRYQPNSLLGILKEFSSWDWLHT
jgi:hypothetical protein